MATLEVFRVDLGARVRDTREQPKFIFICGFRGRNLVQLGENFNTQFQVNINSKLSINFKDKTLLMMWAQLHHDVTVPGKKHASHWLSWRDTYGGHDVSAFEWKTLILGLDRYLRKERARVCTSLASIASFLLSRNPNPTYLIFEPFLVFWSLKEEEKVFWCII